MEGHLERTKKKKNKGCCSRFLEKLPLKQKIKIVYWDFDALNSDEIDLKRGEKVAWIKDKYSKNQCSGKPFRWKWSEVKKLDAEKETGFVLSAFLISEKDYDSISLYKDTSWYVGPKSTLEAQNILQESDSARPGAFVVCAPTDYRSRRELQEYAIIICKPREKSKAGENATDQRIPAFTIHRIYRDTMSRYYIDKKFRTPNLVHLIRSMNFTKVSPIRVRYPIHLLNSTETPVYLIAEKHPIPPPPGHPCRFLFKGKGVTRYEESSPDPAPPKELQQLDRSDIEIEKTPIGKGNFGKVYKGKWTVKTSEPEKDDKSGWITVAVKELKQGAPPEDCESFLAEAKLLAHLDHENVIRIYGICAEKSPVWVMMEYMNRGSLENYLRVQMEKKQKLENRQLIWIIYQIARGMHYLEKENIVHRDLAARNVLVSDETDSGKLSVKICDFGLALCAENEAVAQNPDALPYKWMAPESLTTGKSFTHSSDVWSFGVVIFEVMTHGQVPYPGIENYCMLTHLKGNNRLPQSGMPLRIYQITEECWSWDPENRPHFEELENRLEQAYEKSIAKENPHT